MPPNDDKEVVRIKVKLCDGMMQPDHKKLCIDPQITSFDILNSLLAKAFRITDRPFAISYLCRSGSEKDVYVSLLTDWDLDAAIMDSSSPYLRLRVDLRPFDEGVADWDLVQTENTDTSRLAAVQNSLLETISKTVSSVTKAIGSIGKIQDGIPMNPEVGPITPSLSDAEFRTFLNPVGHLVEPARFRLAVYAGGVEPSLRRVVWRHLLNVYPAQMNGRERFEYFKQKCSEYVSLREKWRSCVRLSETRPSITNLLSDQSKAKQQQSAKLLSMSAKPLAGAAGMRLKEEDVSQKTVGGGLWTPENLHSVTSAVKKDVLRTDRKHPFFSGDDDSGNVVALFNLLVTYALTHPTVSYCQGMSDLAAPLLVVEGDEAGAYICFVGLMNRLRYQFIGDGMSIATKLSHLTLLLEHHDPTFYAFLKDRHSDDLFFTYRWLLLETKREFPLDDAMYALEVMWATLPVSPPPDKEKGLSLTDSDYLTVAAGSVIKNSGGASYVCMKSNRRRLSSEPMCNGSEASARVEKSVDNPNVGKNNSTGVTPITDNGGKLATSAECTPALGENVNSNNNWTNIPLSDISAAQASRDERKSIESKVISPAIVSPNEREFSSSVNPRVIIKKNLLDLKDLQTVKPSSSSSIQVTSPSELLTPGDELNPLDFIALKTAEMEELERKSVSIDSSLTEDPEEGCKSSVSERSGNIIDTQTSATSEGSEVFGQFQENIELPSGDCSVEENVPTKLCSSEYCERVANPLQVLSDPSVFHGRESKLESVNAKCDESYTLESESKHTKTTASHPTGSTASHSTDSTASHPTDYTASHSTGLPVLEVPENESSKSSSKVTSAANKVDNDSDDGLVSTDSGIGAAGSCNVQSNTVGNKPPSERNLTNIRTQSEGSFNSPRELFSTRKAVSLEDTDHIESHIIDIGLGMFHMVHVDSLENDRRRKGDAAVVAHAGTVPVRPSNSTATTTAAKRTGTATAAAAGATSVKPSGSASVGSAVRYPVASVPGSARALVPKLATSRLTRAPVSSVPGKARAVVPVLPTPVSPVACLPGPGSLVGVPVAELAISSSSSSDLINLNEEIGMFNSRLKPSQLNECRRLSAHRDSVDSSDDTTELTSLLKPSYPPSVPAPPCEVSIDFVRVARPPKLPPPEEFGSGNPFLMFLCLAMLLHHRHHIISNDLDYDEISLHYSRLVRKHNVRHIVAHARVMYSAYLRQYKQEEENSAREGENV